MTHYPLVALDQVLIPERDEVSLQPDETYRTAGIYSFGKGLFAREPLTGAETSYRSYFRLRAGQFVYSRLFAWEGAVAIVPPEFDGFFVSQEFPTFTIDSSRADVFYLRALCRWPSFHEDLAGGTKGLGLRRQRVHPQQLLAVKVPLPDVDEQRRVAAKLDNVLKRVATAADKLTRLEELSEAVADAAVQTILARGTNDGWPLRSIEEVAEINPAPSAVDPMATVTFVPMAAVDGVTGTIASAVERFASEVSRGYKQFKRGDVIFARITPCMQNGKSAVANGIKTQYGYGSTEFYVLRPADAVLPDWIHTIVRTRSFRAAAAERFTGTAGQQRVPADFLRAARIPVPRSVGEQRAALARIDTILASHRQTQILQRGQRARLVALEPSLLNRAFAGEL